MTINGNGLEHTTQALNPQQIPSAWHVAADYDRVYGQSLPQPLHIEPVEGGFIITGYFAGSHRRCVVNGIPNLLKTLRSWWGEVKPAKPKKDA